MANLADVDVEFLVQQGFSKLSKQDWEKRVAELKAKGMDNGGTYDLGYELARGPVSVMFEQNISTVISDGLEVMTKHPAVAVIDGPRGRIACPAHDSELILAMVDQVA